MIWAVMVVPTLAPKMMPTACDSDRIPADMKPTVSTVVTDDDCSTAVTKAPVQAPDSRLVVSRARMALRRLPASDFSPSAICSMP